MDESELERMMEEKYRKAYSEELGRYVFVIRSWVEKPVFKRYKTLFGYTDIGWTVKHPKQLIRALVEEGVWTETQKSVDTQPIENNIGDSPDEIDYSNMDLLEKAWVSRSGE